MLFRDAVIFGLLILDLACVVHSSMEHLIFKRESAFDLLRLESEFEAMSKERQQQRLNARSIGLFFNRNVKTALCLVGAETSDEEQCQKQCNDRLKISLDMVKVCAFAQNGL